MNGAVLVVCLLAVTWVPRAARALELVIRIDSGPESGPKEICIAADSRIQGMRCSSSPLPPDMLPVHLDLFPNPNANVTSVAPASGNTFRVVLEPRATPAVITVFSEADARHYESEPVSWRPSTGTAPVVLSVVPRQVTREIEYPEYTCREGQANAPGPHLFDVQRDWTIAKAPQITACNGHLHFRPKRTALSVQSNAAVPFEVSKFDFSWLVHPLFECRGEDAAVSIAASENDLHCQSMEFVDAHDVEPARYTWRGCTAKVLPGRVTLQAACSLYSSGGPSLQPAPRWTETLQYPGQTLSSYTRDEERSIIVRWNGWGGPAPAGAPPEPWRAEREQDRIETIVLRDVGGRELHLSPPGAGGETSILTDSGVRLRRVVVPNAQVGQYFVAQFVGDRVFANETLDVGSCGPSKSQSAAGPIGNCVVIAKPTRRRDEVTLGLRVGAGLGTANPVGPASHFFSPTGELGLHVVRRADSRPIDYELSAVLLAQRWKSYRQNLVESERMIVQESAPLLVIGLEPGMRFRRQSWSWGMSVLAGWGGPALRRNVSSVSDQVVVGGGLSMGYAWSRTVALEVRPRFVLADVRTVALDAGGLTDFEPSRTTWVLQIPLVARFDDIVGD